MANYHVQSPVLLLSFNRPDTALKIFERVREARPAKLYIAADGPRTGVEKDTQLCRETRMIYDQVDWDCSVYKLFSEENKGCKVAVAEAVTWFFQQEEEGIILEDDCLPTSDFFYFCDQLLPRYRHDTRMVNITGTNLQMGKKWGNGSYYFSQYSHIWGWASWRRAWEAYDIDLEHYNEKEAVTVLGNIFSDQFLIDGWIDIFQKLKRKEIDSWDYQFNLINFFRNGLCITPNVNLISNLGFRPDATHTYNVPEDHANLPAEQLEKPLVHPLHFTPEKQADYYFLSKDFMLEEKWRKVRKEQLLRRRFKRWVRSLFK